MNISERIAGDVAIIEIDGRLTVSERPGQIKDVVANVQRRGARHILLDLSGVQYLDSTRLGELIAAHVTVTRRGGRLKLVAPPPRVAELLAIAGLASVFEQYASIDEAAASVTSADG